MTKKSNNNCIRREANEIQIQNCQVRLETIDDRIENVAKILNLAGNNNRLKILFLLNQEIELCPCDLSDILNMSVPAISQHLKKLREGNIIKRRKVGQTIFYSLVEGNDSILEVVLNTITTEKNLTV